MYIKETLPNGIRVVTNEIKNRDSISIGIFVDVGGRYEPDSLKGIAHFIEHMVFKGSKKYTCEQIKELIEGKGGSINAFTSEEQTCFYAKIPFNHLNVTFDVLSDIVFSPLFSRKDLQKEKTVILEEIKMYHDLPQYYVLEMLDSIIWPNHPLGKSLTGTKETVSIMSEKDLKKFHNLHYVPENIVISACGNLNHKAFIKLINKKLSFLKVGQKGDFEKFICKQNSPAISLFKKNIEQMHIGLGMHAYDENHKDRYVLSLLSTILGGNMSSRLFVEVREKQGLAYSISSNFKSLHDTGLFLVRAGVDNKKVVKAVALILKELKKIKRFGINKSEFDRGRDYLLGQFQLALEDTMEHMLWIGDNIITRDKIKTLRDFIKTFEKMKTDDLMRVAHEIFDEKKFNLSIVGPIDKNQENEFKNLMAVKSIKSIK